MLPHLESGLVTLIGATTENPFHEVNPAIRSRCGQIQQLKPLKPDDLMIILKRALADPERGVGEPPVVIDESLLWRIAEAAGGDARVALSLLEAAVAAADERHGRLYIDEDIVASCTANRGFTHDKYGDHYYSLLSAFQKACAAAMPMPRFIIWPVCLKAETWRPFAGDCL